MHRKENLLKAASLAYAVLVILSACTVFRPKFMGPIFSRGNYDANRGASPLGHVCFSCGRPATRSVEYSASRKFFCDTCTPPAKVHLGSQGRDEDPIAGSMFTALVFVLLHVAGLYYAFMALRDFCFGVPFQPKSGSWQSHRYGILLTALGCSVCVIGFVRVQLGKSAMWGPAIDLRPATQVERTTHSPETSRPATAQSGNRPVPGSPAVSKSDPRPQP